MYVCSSYTFSYMYKCADHTYMHNAYILAHTRASCKLASKSNIVVPWVPVARGSTATSTVARIDNPSICESSGGKSHTPDSMLELPVPT